MLTISENYEKSSWVRNLKDLLLLRGDINVILVYWAKGAGVNYFQAVGNTRLVGAQIAFLIRMFHEKSRLSYDNVHVIGFSLGAQVAGFAGSRLRKYGSQIARITGVYLHSIKKLHSMNIHHCKIKHFVATVIATHVKDLSFTKQASIQPVHFMPEQQEQLD